MVVVGDDRKELLASYYQIKSALEDVGCRLGFRLDLLLLTESEFYNKPLWNWHELRPIYLRDLSMMTYNLGSMTSEIAHATRLSGPPLV
jgi:hypothetical protein